MFPNKPGNTRSKAVATVMVLLAVVLVTFGVKAYEKRQKSATSLTTAPSTNTTLTPTDTTASAPTDTQQSSSPTTTSSFKDGAYTASSDYYVPHGAENISVTLSIKNGVVTNSSISNSETNPESAQFQEDFASQYKSYVVGKSISGLRLSYVAGASDTAQGFNDAVQQIQTQAQA